MSRHGGGHQAFQEGDHKMQSNNPVFRNSDGFGGRRNGRNVYGNATYAGNGAPYAGYGQGPVITTPYVSGETMTIDGVVQKTALSLLVLIVAAVVTWIATPNLRTPNVNLAPFTAALVLGGGIAFVLSWVNSLKRVASAPLVLLFAAAEGVALGAFSKLVDATYSTSSSGNLVVQAVIGTFAALAGTLAAYKYLNVRVGARASRVAMAIMFGLVGLSVLELVLGLFGHAMGLFGFTALGLITAFLGLAVGIFMLFLDFQQVEVGVRNQLPASEGWRAAFGLTVSLVWIYQNILRILAIFANSNR